MIMGETGMRPAVSVIVPIYNVEPFFERCLRSLFGQTLEDMEYIFVNDCTPDDSMSLLEKVLNDYPHRREQVRIINHERNMGLGATRKDGMKAAQGDYVISCDSDDWIDTDAYEKMYATAIEEDADLVCCGYYGEYANKRIARRPSYPYTSNKEDAAQKLKKHAFIDTDGVWMLIWNKLVQRKLYVDWDIYPYEGVNMGEDWYVSMRLCYLSAKTAIVAEPLYHYNLQNTSSYMAVALRQFTAFVDAYIYYVRQLEAFFQEHNAHEKYEQQIYCMEFKLKIPFLLGGHFQEWLSLVPETHRYIWSYPAIKFHRRIFYTLAANGIFIHYKLRNRIVRCLPALFSRR